MATTTAASAAATLLSSGDYALAYPGSLIHFHGVRKYSNDPITVETASSTAKYLKASNDQTALNLAQSCRTRFFFRYVSLLAQFDQFRGEQGKNLSDKDCLVGLLASKLSGFGLEVIQKAENRSARYEDLAKKVWKGRKIANQLAKVISGKGSYRNVEAEMIKAIVSFELHSNRNSDDWTFASHGMSQLSDDFYLIVQFFGYHRNDWLEEFCEQWHAFLMEPSSWPEIESLPEKDRNTARMEVLLPRLLPIWLFFGSVCQVLHDEENPLTPHDAFWLGLIDEVVGSEDLPTLRKVLEHQPASHPKVMPAGS